MKKNTIHIVFSGGGTAGHLFPGLAVAQRLAAAISRVRITFCGVGKPLERKSVTRAGFDYVTLPARPLPGGAREAVAFLVENLASYLAAGRYLREEHVAAVVGLGGYASVPMARAATRRHVPLVLLEQNAVAGKATRWLARRAALICTSFEQTGALLRCQCPIRATGNPVRGEFFAKSSGERRDSGRPNDPSRRVDAAAKLNPDLQSPLPDLRSLIPDPQSLIPDPRSPIPDPQSLIPNPQSLIPNPSLTQLLVLGGSGGARSLNENVPRALYKIRQQLAGWQIVHQSGEADFDATRNLYAKFDLPATVTPFLGDMPTALAATDLAVCRAGGTTLAELAIAGVPAVLLPYPHAADDHQAANARHFAAGGGCITIDERDVPGRLDDHLADMLCFLVANEGLRRQMSAAMGELARPNAAADVAELIWSIVSSRSLRAELSAVL